MASKQCGFGDRIHWFRVGRQIRVKKKKHAVSKISAFVWTLPQYLRHHDFDFVYPVWIHHHPHEYATAVSNCQLLDGDDILELFKEQYPSKTKVVVRLLSVILLLKYRFTW